MKKEVKHWPQTYSKLTSRNIGIISYEKQEYLRKTKVLISGMGGLGSPCFESLVRAGIGSFHIVDNDTFDETNMNRQIFAFTDTIGQKKIDVAEQFALKINPDVKIQKFETITEKNIDKILDHVDVIVQAIDQLKPCIISARKASMNNIPYIEGWALPYANVRVFTANTISLEEAYELPSIGRDLNSISDEEFNSMVKNVLLKFEKVDGISAFYGEDIRERIAKGKFPSFGPIVWLTAITMAIETLKVLLDTGDINYAPDFSFYDPFKQRIGK